MSSTLAKRSLEAADTPFERAKRKRYPTLKAREGDGTSSTPTQAIDSADTQPDEPIEVANKAG